MTQRVIQNAKNQSANLVLMNPRAFRRLATIPIEESKKPQRFATDGKTIFVNVSYAKGLGDKEIRGILIHELLHILGRHRWRRGDFHRELWNIATDYVINGEIVRNDRFGKDFTLPENILFDKIYSAVGWRAEEVAHDLLRRGWDPPEEKRDEPPNDGPVCTLGGVGGHVFSPGFVRNFLGVRRPKRFEIAQSRERNTVGRCARRGAPASPQRLASSWRATSPRNSSFGFNDRITTIS